MLLAQQGILDPAFEKIPFDQWQRGGEQAHLHWSAVVTRPYLSHQQRLLATVQVTVDGADIAARRGKGELVLFIQIKDATGRKYQSHESINLSRVEPSASASDVIYSQPAFVLPGAYHLELAFLDTASGEHAVLQKTFVVPPLANDPLPEAWRDVPPVEFIDRAEAPDNWFLPSLTGRLNLNVETRRPTRIELILNLSTTQDTEDEHPHDVRPALIPALKAISQVQFRNASLNISLLDVSRQRVAFEQRDVRGSLNWPAVRERLTAKDAQTIDLKSLETRQQQAQFFVGEVRRRLAPQTGESEAQRVLIVLSGAVAFDRGEDLARIDAKELQGYRVFYIRYLEKLEPPAPRTWPPESSWGGRGMGGRRRTLPPPRQDVEFDQLEPLLKPLGPRCFDVETPEQFRKALATLLAAIAKI